MISRASSVAEVAAWLRDKEYPQRATVELDGLTGADLWLLTRDELVDSGIPRTRAMLLYRQLHARDEEEMAFRCPITLATMTDPVTLDDGNGHSYDKKALESWFKTGNTTSPLTGAHLTSDQMKWTPNRALRAAIDSYGIGRKPCRPHVALIDDICMAGDNYVEAMRSAMGENDTAHLERRKRSAIEFASGALRRCVDNADYGQCPDGLEAIWLAVELSRARPDHGQCIALRCYRGARGAWTATAEYYLEPIKPLAAVSVCDLRRSALGLGK